MVHDLYEKEREYQRKVFGDYKNSKALTFPSFILFLERYVEKAKKAYVEKWDSELPPWLLTCSEYEKDCIAPVEAYEEIIKVMALAGAALETYAAIDPSKWREDFEKESQKWKK